jgi:hypothetical protein
VKRSVDSPTSGKVVRMWGLVLLVLAAAVAIAWWLSGENAAERATQHVPNGRPRPVQTFMAVAPAGAPTATVQPRSAHVSLASNLTPESASVNGEQAERPHAHPIDNERHRIYRENSLNMAMMGAMNVGDYVGLRALIERYRAAYPEDEYHLQEGYSLVADCLERLTVKRRDDAREYWRNNRGSLVRRFIRRHCLEKPVVNG